MSTVTRSVTYTANTIIDPDVHNTEHDAFMAAINDNYTRIQGILNSASTFAGNNLHSGSATFSGNVIVGSSSGTANFLHKDLGMSGPAPTYNSNVSVIIPQGLSVMDATGARMMRVSSDITLSLSVTGAGGLDGGSVSSGSKVYAWVCAGASGVTAIWSTSTTAPTLPSGYDTYKRRLPLAYVLNGSSQIREHHIENWRGSTKIVFKHPINIINGVAASSLTTVSLGAYVPATARSCGGIFDGAGGSSGTATLFTIHEVGDASPSHYLTFGSVGYASINTLEGIRLNTSQQFDWKGSNTSNSFNGYLKSYTITEEA